MTRTASFLRAFRHLEIEEKILNGGALLAVVGVFMPWFGGEWFGKPEVWTGFGFYTSFVGLLIFLAHLFTLALTVFPLLGHALVRPSLRDLLRLIVGAESILLIVVVISILTNVSFDFSQMEVRFGVYLTLVGSIVVALYAFLRMQQQQRREVQELFHHPEVTPLPPTPAARSRREVAAVAPTAPSTSSETLEPSPLF